MFFEKQLWQRKRETRTNKKQSTSKVQKVQYTCGREMPNVQKQETKYYTAARGKHVRQFEKQLRQ
jgi:hypothetical protein